MDTTKEYIEMCKKAVEIQRMWTEDTREYGDYFAEIQSNEYVTTDVFCSCPEENNLEYVKNPVWLPRQDQLQGMLKDKYQSKGFMLVTCFVDWMKKGGLDKTMVSLCSMEQLWLAFVMYEKYGKTWNADKKEWIR